MLIARIAFALASAALQEPAAPEVQGDTPDEIVVQGVRPSRKQVRDFVRALTAVPSFGQIGRFRLPVCPAAIGLAPVQNARVAERMRRVAAAAKVPVAPAKCTPNAFVIVAADKPEAITELNRLFPAYFSQMSEREVRRLAEAAGPAAAWQVKTLMTADGELAPKTIGADYYTVKSVNTPSRIKAASIPTFLASVVVIDVKSAAGLTLTQLADYAAMRTLADIAPERVAKVGVPSILTVLGQPDDRPLPVTLTHWDLGFLKSLYSTDNAYLATYQRGDMERVLKKEVEQSARKQKR
jgi:hypothetical protein